MTALDESQPPQSEGPICHPRWEQHMTRHRPKRFSRTIGLWPPKTVHTMTCCGWTDTRSSREAVVESWKQHRKDSE